jgi:hypothetical protein
MGKRRFGRVRKLPSGRWQARYPGPSGMDHPAPHTFATKKDADRWLTVKEADITRGDWFDPTAGSVPFAEYAGEWMEDRELSPKSEQLYELLLRRHLNPTFGLMAIGVIKEETVRKWRAGRLKAGPSSDPPFGPVTVAKAYRLLRAVLNTAVKDKRIRENPCCIEVADKESSPERPVLSIAEVYRLADASYCQDLWIRIFWRLATGVCRPAADGGFRVEILAGASCRPGRGGTRRHRRQRLRSGGGQRRRERGIARRPMERS